MLGYKCFSGKWGFFILIPHGTDRATWTPIYFFFQFPFFSAFISRHSGFFKPFTISTITECVQQCFPCFPQRFQTASCFAGIYTFPIDVRLTDFATQHITWCTEVIQSLLHSVLWAKWRVSKRFFSGSSFNLLALFGSGVTVFVEGRTGGRTHYGPTGDVLPRPKCSSLSRKPHFCQITENSVVFCVQILFLLANSAIQKYRIQKS